VGEVAMDRGWRQWSEEDARSALAELSSTRESVTEFARRKGVSVERIRYWRKRLMQHEVPAFMAVPVSDGARAQIEIAVAGLTMRIREDVDLERLSDLVDIVTRSSRRC
jgi:transposase-like protein